MSPDLHLKAERPQPGCESAKEFLAVILSTNVYRALTWRYFYWDCYGF